MLVKMWVAHGVLNDGSDGKSMEDVATEYFNELLSRSFFQATQQENITRYVIHEQIHSMIRSVSADYFMMIQGNCATKIPLTVRHLSVTSGWLAQLRKFRVLKRLRTLLVFRDPKSPLCVINADLFKELNGVRVLYLTGTDITNLPEGIGHLMHMRYLALPHTLHKLPAAVTKLFHLQTLLVSKDSHTDVAYEFCATELEELAGMNSLRGTLSITGLDAVAKEGAKRAQIGKKKSVRVLKYEWKAELTSEPKNATSDLDVLEGLQPHTGLEVLHIKRYRGTSSPAWLTNNCLKQLKRLYLINCRVWEVLPPFGYLPRLNYLRIKEMNSVQQIDGSGSFESLETLVLDDMPSLVEWTAGATDSRFSSLRKMEILCCPKLNKLAPMSASLKSLKIRGCPEFQQELCKTPNWEKGYTDLQLDIDF